MKFTQSKRLQGNPSAAERSRESQSPQPRSSGSKGAYELSHRSRMLVRVLTALSTLVLLVGCEGKNVVLESMRAKSDRQQSTTQEASPPARSGETGTRPSERPSKAGAGLGTAAETSPENLPRLGPHSRSSTPGTQKPPSSAGGERQDAAGGANSTGAGAARYRQVELRRPVQLPQTGPNGIMMSFSVDFQFVQGSPLTDATYWLVIRSQSGRDAAFEIPRGRSRGILDTIVEGWRPEDGPFTAVLEERRGAFAKEELSEVVTFR